MLDAAALAAILDPERKVPGWWGQEKLSFSHDWFYTGPLDLATAPEHCWRMQEWLIAHDCEILITRHATFVEGPAGTGCTEIAQDTNHTAALNAAIERISNG